MDAEDDLLQNRAKKLCKRYNKRKGKNFGVLPQLFFGSQPRHQKNFEIRFDTRGNSGGNLSFGQTNGFAEKYADANAKSSKLCF